MTEPEATGVKEPNGGLEPGGETGGVAFMPGRLATAYDVGKAVGKGGYAVVYKGIRQEDGRIVAVKKVEIFEMTQKKRERCLQEVKLLQQLSHPFVIQMLDAFIDENMLIIVFEWAPAGDLKRLIKKTAEAGRTLDEASIWNFFAQITDALRYMHQHRIMHRDIKPANVLVGANGALKLADLGLGRQLSEQTMEAFSKVGTPYYVSPEVVRGAGYDWKSDVWSLGCLLYELACLHSPFEMEGANLYDVFQKISKGEFQPLPADQFSSSLRNLVVRMLSVEPAKRPDLDEVWSITQSIVQAQTKSRQDIHTLSEDLYQQLALIEADVTAKMAGGGGGGKAANGKRGSNTGAADILVAPPVEALRVMHPLYLSERAGHLTARDADENQKRQLGVFMQVFSWLLRLNGKNDLAQAIDAHLEMVPVPNKNGRVWPPQPPLAVQATKSPSSSISRARSSKVSAAAAAAAIATANGSNGGAEGPAVVAPPSTAPSCINILKGADAVKRGAQGLGLSTEFAPVNALATGFGRAVCSILQETLEITASRLQPMARRPRYTESAMGTSEAAQNGEENPDDDDAVAAGACAADDGADMFASASRNAYDDAEEEQAYMMDGPDSIAGGRPAESSSAASQPGASSGSGQQQAGGHVQHTKVDPAAWRLELERLAPQLSRIRLPADGSASSAYGDWHNRWQATKTTAQGIAAEAPPVQGALKGLGSSVTSDLERIATSERHLNANVEGPLGQYRAARERLAEVQRYVRQHEELQQAGNNALEQLNAQLEETGTQMQEHAASLSSSTHVKEMQDAIKRLRKEMGEMSVRIGVLQHQLAAKQRRHMMHLAEGGGLDWGEKGDLDDDL